ncbi:hypothetical protein [Parabacteroides sp. ZJ-118]|uniref:hypothetical protein n=1 Tax=Parabacteroides sp. ZJ-118 TaxID=2709398 RepID=UPI0013EB3B10|nr:hypothetical protein [Parabacteroides sp. ZJ-118]
MTENQERAEKARSGYTINGGNVQILPNATIAIQNIHCGDGTVTRTERWITPAESGLHESPSPPVKSPAPSATAEPSSLALFIPDEAVRLAYEARLCACPDTVVLCQTVLTDLYNDILADYSSPRKLVKSRAFINAILPHLTFVNGANVPSIRYGIRKYVLGEG